MIYELAVCVKSKQSDTSFFALYKFKKTKINNPKVIPVDGIKTIARHSDSINYFKMIQMRTSTNMGVDTTTTWMSTSTWIHVGFFLYKKPEAHIWLRSVCFQPLKLTKEIIRIASILKTFRGKTGQNLSLQLVKF